jgi:hypothetical protein
MKKVILAVGVLCPVHEFLAHWRAAKKFELLPT